MPLEEAKTIMVGIGIGSIIVCLAGLGLFEANAIQFLKQILTNLVHSFTGTTGVLTWDDLQCTICQSVWLLIISECKIQFNMSDPKSSYNTCNCKLY